MAKPFGTMRNGDMPSSGDDSGKSSRDGSFIDRIRAKVGPEPAADTYRPVVGLNLGPTKSGPTPVSALSTTPTVTPWSPAGASTPSTPPGGAVTTPITSGVYSSGNPITPYVGGSLKL